MECPAAPVRGPPVVAVPCFNAFPLRLQQKANKSLHRLNRMGFSSILGTDENTWILKNLFARHLLFLTRSADLPSFQKIPGAAGLLDHHVPGGGQLLYEKLRRRCPVPGSGIPG